MRIVLSAETEDAEAGWGHFRLELDLRLDDRAGCGLVPMQGAREHLVMELPRGLVRVRADRRNGNGVNGQVVRTVDLAWHQHCCAHDERQVH